ncbi:MAG: hypothetical protein BroJett003_13110 [Planctomycetota bacterium]|nr:MAG: hypothetical protein BroJett003_13110 [Planctomycetota bacterium]
MAPPPDSTLVSVDVRVLRISAVVVALAAVSLCAWWVLGPPEAPCVLLISLDTTRADHLGCYGHSGGATPNLDALAARGAVFLRCTSSVPLTTPSHASLFTGLYPFEHGVRDNGVFALAEEFTTVAERFSDAGYRTAAFLSATVLNAEFGLDQGFDQYVDMRAAPGRDGRGQGAERCGSVTSDLAIEFLKTVTDEPFFLFVHYFDPHDPYQAPAPHSEQFDDPYVAEIAHVDAQIGRLLAALDELGLDSRTHVVIVADHGEGRGDHGEQTHGAFIYESTMRVPLIIRSPAGEPRRIEAQVRTIDVAPTLLDLAGLDPLDAPHAVSLRPLIEGGELNLAAYSETFLPRFSYGYSQLRALYMNGWKYVHAPQPELYDLSQDPGEFQNLASAHPNRLAGMRSELRRLIASTRPAHRGRGAQGTSEEVAGQLQALGYLSTESVSVEDLGETEVDLFTPDGPDPKDNLDAIDGMSAAAAQLNLGDFAAAEQTLRDLLERRDPATPTPFRAHVLLGRALFAQERFDEAVEAFQAALSRNPGDAATLTNLGNALGKLKRFDEAIVVYRAATQIEPPLPRAFLNLSLALAARRDWDEACVAVQEAIRLDPASAKAHAHHAVVLLSLRRPAEALKSIRRAAELEPDNPEYRQALQQLQGAAPKPGR